MASLPEVRARFARGHGLPFADSLTESSIRDALNQHGVTFRDRLFSPVTTIWGFLSQVLSEDKSCRDAVARILAHRAASGLAQWRENVAAGKLERGRETECERGGDGYGQGKEQNRDVQCDPGFVRE